MLLAVVLVWNISLRKLSERRGRELFRNQIVRAESELRIDERTRIAAELHDHLAQNLTAIAYQLASAERSRISEPKASAGHLASSLKMLNSCRTELRRCLWDLKSDALNESDIAVAIRKSIEPVSANATVNVIFPVLRSKLSDSTVHTILSITRELAANAVNHGKANLIDVKGKMSDGILRFTVTDNGSGFNPTSAPNTADGHFGLDGIRERLLKHNGSIIIDSAPGNGCRIIISIISGKSNVSQKQ
jgi:signal transduction histidine kinase